MTAEIAVMNKACVALAADSAVTVSMSGERKVYNSANKLFMLSKHHPIGIMIYGNAQLMNMPWETIIKIYREKLGEKDFDYAFGYVEDFLAFLGNDFFTKEDQDSYMEHLIYGEFQRLVDEIDNELTSRVENDERFSKDDKDAVKAITEEVLNEHFGEWENYPYLADFTGKYVEDFIKKHRAVINKIMQEVLEQLPLDPRMAKKILRMSAYLFSRDRFTENVAGVVVAGFGSKEMFPCLYDIGIECVVDNRLKYKILRDPKVSDKMPISISAFAQSEMVSTFIEGTDPALSAFSLDYLGTVFEELPEIICNRVKFATDKDKEGFEKEMTELVNGIIQDYKEALDTYKHVRHVSPILEMAMWLPKDEIAVMAETLVNLTSFKRRITKETETVGGPIDVAVISKGDGFVWIKRKHYFDPELNHHFFSNYFKGV